MSEMLDGQAAGINRRRIGDYIVTAVSDGYLDLPFDLLTGISSTEATELTAASGRPRSSVMALGVYVIQGRGQTILVDGGAGGINGWGGRLQSSLVAANLDPRQVDTILLTHAHPDHLGGLMGASNSAKVFPNAELVLNDKEFDFWTDDGHLSRAQETAIPFFHLARGVFEAYKGRIRIVAEGDVLPGIDAIHLPGHTPGHSGYRISSGNAGLLLWGDIVHYPSIQVARPDVTIAFDVDPAAAARTRKSLLDMAAADDLLVGGMHLNFPGFARIRKTKGQYAIFEEPWSPALV